MTSASTRPLATDKALAVTELREAIISHLSSKDIILAQRVCKLWKATIKGSLLLQRCLGFVPNCSSLIKQTDPNLDFAEMHTPTALLSGHSALHFFETSMKPNAYIINPLVECLFTKDPWREDLFFLPGWEVEELTDDEQSRWGKIYLTQPPATFTFVGWRCRCEEAERNEDDLNGCLVGVENSGGSRSRTCCRHCVSFSSATAILSRRSAGGRKRTP